MALTHKPCVSVVMSVYNCLRFVQASIDSILNQTFQDWEFIIIDDGSTDGTSNVLSRASADARIKLIRHDNLGLARSLNQGINLARGKYIARQDADDISLPIRIEAQVRLLESMSELSLVGCWAEWMDEDGTCLQILDYPTEHREIQERLLKQCCFTHGSVVLRKSAFDAVGGYCEDFVMSQDYDLWLRMSERFKVANLPQVLYKYRKTKDGISCRMYKPREKYKEMARARAQERYSHLGDTQP